MSSLQTVGRDMSNARPDLEQVYAELVVAAA